MDPHENLARPAIDPLFRSAAAAYGPAVVGVVLTGQLNDGTPGLIAVKDCGGFTIVQGPFEATAASMPRSAIRHVNVDRVCTLAEMADLFVQLADDDPPTEEQERVSRLMQIENRIAEGIFSVEDWWNLEQMSVPSGLNCPNCSSALYELDDKRLLRFRCRSGHGYTAECLLNGQAEAREAHLSNLFGALVEEASLAERMQRDPKLSAESVTNLAARVGELGRQADQVSGWHAMTNLVEPELA
jgi:two-component system chemotaxis response regulator CheB